MIVLQGERPLAKDNKKLGMFRLDNIPAAPKGASHFESSVFFLFAGESWWKLAQVAQFER